MSQADQLKLIDVRQPVRRVLVVVPVLAAVALAWYAVRWYVGDFVAEFAPQMEERQMDAALAAMHLAPDDPWTHWMVASLKKKSFLPEELVEAVRQYEEAVRLSPNDYRLWLDLGRAREEVGDSAGGELALRRAVSLAPSYAYPRWYLGNLLLRAGRGEEAFAELRRAAEADPVMRPQLLNVAWTLYGQDVEAIKKVIGETAAARAEFALYLAKRGNLDDALGLWSSLSPAEKKNEREAGAAVMSQLLERKRYHAAHAVFNDLNGEANSREAQFDNGGFEADVDTEGGNPFTWRVKNDPQAQMKIDGATRHSGERSLRILFRATEKLEFNNLSQLVTVEPATQYRLEFFVRAEDLKGAGTPTLAVLDATDGSTVLAATPALSPGTYDWQPVTINFKTSPKTEGVIVQLYRAQCGGDAICPIFGMVWYDDFNLQTTGGTTNPRDARQGYKRGA